MLSKSLLTLSALLLAAASVGAQPTSSHLASTMTIRAAEASGEPSGILKYVPNKGGNYFVGGLYALYSLVFFFYIYRRKDKWALCLPSAVSFRPSVSLCVLDRSVQCQSGTLHHPEHVRRHLACRLPRL